MDEKYVPPYEITDEMLNLVTQIMENLGKLNSVNEFEKLPRLRRVNRIKTIQSSLAIENNTLSIEQVTDVIDGKRIIGPKEDIIAVQNANLTYKEMCANVQISTDKCFSFERINVSISESRLTLNNLGFSPGCLIGMDIT